MKKKNKLKPSNYFDDWLEHLTDKRAARLVRRRIWSAENGNFGKRRVNIAEGVSEMKIDFGPGYRIYYCQRGETFYLLLIGGDKSTQQSDIAWAIEIKKEAEREKKW
jgi:putative addiction module killer protein